MIPAERLGEGRTAEIFAWEDGLVLKLYYAEFPAELAETEAHLTGLVAAAGVPAPAVHGTLTLDGRRGIIFERLKGPVMVRAVRARPWALGALARQLAELHAAIHACHAPADLPSQRERLIDRVGRAPGLTAATRDRLLAGLAALPDGELICHSDLHPENVLLTAHGPLAIDWMDVVRGNPAADVARTLLILRAWPHYTARSLERLARRAFSDTFAAIYLRRYRQLNPAITPQGLAAWRAPVAAARLLEGISAEEAYLRRLAGQSS
jgi:Ser/Thr protein kinase RdoA (MazF antagonist)